MRQPNKQYTQFTISHVEKGKMQNVNGLTMYYVREN